MKKFVTAHSQLLSLLLASASALALGIYAGIYTAYEPPAGEHINFATRVLRLKWSNLAFLAGAAFLLGQYLLHVLSERQRKASEEETAEALVVRMLESIVSINEAHRPWLTYRALVMIADESTKSRRTICGANIRTDPEDTQAVPIDFGVSGRAFMTRTMQAEDVDPQRDLAAGVDTWAALGCVLAFPMLTAQGVAFGTINFDANASLADAGLDRRAMQAALATVAAITGYLMRGRSPDGTARYFR